MRALITNDDGIDSVGLHGLARAAVAAGFEVTVAAPHKEASGSSAALSGLAAGGSLRYQARDLPDIDGVPAFAVEASPAMIAFVGMRGAFGDPPDVVLSGVNNGPNTGQAVLHSGTVGAALTAASSGLAALAVSLATTAAQHWDAQHWKTAEDAASRVVRWFAAHPPQGQVVNVNVPDVPLAELRGFRAATLAPFGAVQADIGERRDEDVAITFAESELEAPEGSDLAVLSAGWASVTLIGPPCEFDPLPLDDLR
jgi:5'-nucleotidase